MIYVYWYVEKCVKHNNKDTSISFFVKKHSMQLQFNNDFKNSSIFYR